MKYPTSSTVLTSSFLSFIIQKKVETPHILFPVVAPFLHVAAPRSYDWHYMTRLHDRGNDEPITSDTIVS